MKLKREPRASMEEAGHRIDDVARLLRVARRTVEDWLSERVPTEIPQDRLRLYRHLAGIERIPFRRR